MRRVISLLAFALPLVGSASLHAQQRSPAVARQNEAYVLIEGPKTATLERQDGATFRAVCLAPCDRPFEIGKTYRIAGDDVHASEPFELQGTAGSTVVLTVDDTKHHTGALVTQGGVLVTLVGGFTLFGGVFGSCSEGDLGDACNGYRWLTVTGTALVAVGVATIITGIVLMAGGSHAEIEQIEQKTGQERARDKPARPDARVFAPEAGLAKGLAPDAPTTSLFSFSF